MEKDTFDPMEKILFLVEISTGQMQRSARVYYTTEVPKSMIVAPATEVKTSRRALHSHQTDSVKRTRRSARFWGWLLQHRSESALSHRSWIVQPTVNNQIESLSVVLIVRVVHAVRMFCMNLVEKLNYWLMNTAMGYHCHSLFVAEMAITLSIPITWVGIKEVQIFCNIFNVFSVLPVLFKLKCEGIGMTSSYCFQWTLYLYMTIWWWIMHYLIRI